MEIKKYMNAKPNEFLELLLLRDWIFNCIKFENKYFDLCFDLLLSTI